MKILVLGDNMVGKTALISKFLNKSYEYIPTIEEMYTFNTGCVNHEIHEVTLDLLVHPGYFKQCQAFLIVFDVTMPTSFCSVKTIIDRIRSFESRPKVIYIFGTNVDQKNFRSISKKQGKLLAFHYECVYMEGSTVTGKNVSKIFSQIIRNSVNKPESHTTRKYFNFSKSKRQSLFSIFR